MVIAGSGESAAERARTGSRVGEEGDFGAVGTPPSLGVVQRRRGNSPKRLFELHERSSRRNVDNFSVESIVTVRASTDDLVDGDLEITYSESQQPCLAVLRNEVVNTSLKFPVSFTIRTNATVLNSYFGRSKTNY
jgi:hypothetical protein